MNIIDKEWVKNNISEDGIVIIPSGVESIAAEAFKGNELIKKVVLSDTVVEIGDSAFEECKNLQEVQFGNGIKCGAYIFFFRIFNEFVVGIWAVKHFG